MWVALFDTFVFRVIPWAKPHRHTQTQWSEASHWASWRLENMETYGWCNKHKRATRDVGWVCRRLWTGYMLVRNGSDTGSAGAVIQLQRLDNKTRKGRLLTPQPTIRRNSKIQEKRKRETQALIDLTGISAALGDWIFSAGVWPRARPPSKTTGPLIVPPPEKPALLDLVWSIASLYRCHSEGASPRLWLQSA